MDFIFCARLCVFVLKSCEFLSQALCKKQNLPSQNCGLIRFCVPSNSQISSTKQITRTENPTPQVACCGPRARYSNGHWCWSWDPPGSALLSGKCGESVSGRWGHTMTTDSSSHVRKSLFTSLRSYFWLVMYDDYDCEILDFARFAMICNKYSRYYIQIAYGAPWYPTRNVARTWSPGVATKSPWVPFKWGWWLKSKEVCLGKTGGCSFHSKTFRCHSILHDCHVRCHELNKNKDFF